MHDFFTITKKYLFTPESESSNKKSIFQVSIRNLVKDYKKDKRQKNLKKFDILKR